MTPGRPDLVFHASLSILALCLSHGDPVDDVSPSGSQAWSAWFLWAYGHEPPLGTRLMLEGVERDRRVLGRWR